MHNNSSQFWGKIWIVLKFGGQFVTKVVFDVDWWQFKGDKFKDVIFLILKILAKLSFNVQIFPLANH